MHLGNHALIGAATQIPVNETKPVISYSPVVLPAKDRPVPLELRVTYPAKSTKPNEPLPILLFAHGQGRSNSLSSLEGYAPLTEFYAAHGFAVLQPTHLSSSFLGLKWPVGKELWWQERAQDFVRVLDNLDQIEADVPGLGAGRLDRSRVAIVGHSAGTLSVSMLLGASNTDPRSGEKVHVPEPRIKAGVVLGGLGKAGEDLSENGKNVLVPFYGLDFSTMNGPALVVYGDEDVSPHLTVRGADWHGDAYTLAPGSKDLLTLKGGHHGLGGIAGWDAAETKDENPERLATVQRMTWAYLKSQLYEGDKSWTEASEAFKKLGVLGTLENKQ